MVIMRQCNPSQGGQYCRITPLEEGVAPARDPTICDAPLYAVPLPPYSLEVRFQTVWGERHRIFQGRAYSRVTGRCHLGWPHPNSESDKKIRARYFLPLYDPYKWIPKGILILTTRRPLPRLKFFGFFAPHVGLQTSTAYCSQLNCHEF